MYNFIVNPNAGSGRGMKLWKAMARYMDNHNIEYEAFLTEGIGDARLIARRLTDGVREPRYIILDGVKKVEFNNILFISCHIQPSEGGGFLFAPGADGSDGKMNICVVSHAAKARMIPVLLSALTRRKGKQKGVRSFECREIAIHTEAALPVHADGECCGLQTDIQAGCIARKVRMMV